MEPRLRMRLNLPVVELAWRVATGPAFAEDVEQCLNLPGVTGYVALTELGHVPAASWGTRPVLDVWRLCGYMQVYEARRFLVVQHLLVHPAVQRLGVGSALLERAKLFLCPVIRKRLIVDVRQGSRYLAAHKFLAAQGLVARLHPDDPDKLRFQLVVGKVAA